MLQDLRFGIRMLFRNKGFTAIAVLTLALGIGANTAIFSLVNAVLLRPLPFQEPASLVMVSETHPEIARLQASTPDFNDWREQAQSFAEMAAWSLNDLGKTVITAPGDPEQLQSTLVTPNLFPLLGLNPALGRNFLPEENQEGRDRVAMISHSLWRNRFASDRRIIGQSIRLNGENHLVIGVSPQGAQFPFETDVWLPLSQLGAQFLTNRVRHPLEVVARLKPGVTINQARVEMEAIAARLQQTYPDTNKTIGVALYPLQDQLLGDLKPMLLSLFGVVGLVLLITCANVANLLLGRAARRRQEVAVRAALGAGSGRLFRQFLTESLLLAFLGGLFGLLLAMWSLPFLVAALPDVITQQLPAIAKVNVDLYILGFTFLITVLTGILFGLIPAFQLSGFDLNQTLKEGGKGASGGARHRASRALVVAEIALTVTALFGAGLLLRSYQRLTQVDLGFRPERLLTMKFTLPASKYQQPQQIKSFHERLLQGLSGLPGVESAGVIDNFPLAPSNAKTRFGVEGAPPPAPGKFPVAQLRSVNQDFFRVMGVQIKSGRVFTDEDIQNNRSYIVINESLARRYFPSENAVGKKILMGVMFPNPAAIPILGVVADVKDQGLATPVEPTIYFAGFTNQPTIMIRTHGDPSGLAAAARRVVAATDSEQPVSRIRTMEELLSVSLARRRLSALLTAAFAGLALILSAMGVYGVLAWTISERTREIGVRLALGAQTSDILKLVFRQGMTLTLSGLCIGFLASLPAASMIKSLLFGVREYDPTTFAVIACLILLTALLACWLPARKATRVDPIIALRQE